MKHLQETEAVEIEALELLQEVAENTWKNKIETTIQLRRDWAQFLGSPWVALKRESYHQRFP